MPHEPDDEKIKVLLFNERDDGLHGVSRKYVGLDRNASCLCLRARRVDHRR